MIRPLLKTLKMSGQHFILFYIKWSLLSNKKNAAAGVTAPKGAACGRSEAQQCNTRRPLCPKLEPNSAAFVFGQRGMAAQKNQ